MWFEVPHLTVLTTGMVHDRNAFPPLHKRALQISRPTNILHVPEQTMIASIRSAFATLKLPNLHGTPNS